MTGQVSRVIQTADGPERSFAVRVEGAPYLVFYKKLNPGSIFPPAYEVCVYPLAESLAGQTAAALADRRRRRARAAGRAAGQPFRLAAVLPRPWNGSRPIPSRTGCNAPAPRPRWKRPAANSQRAARFSADASHQLKTPVTVLRAGLEELLVHDGLTAETRDEISALVHQTYRLNGVIEDLLLLSRMDAGRLRLEIGAVNLTAPDRGWLDDLSALPDPLGLQVETDLPAELCIAGEKRYTTLIVQNLLENARKYNRADGRIRIAAREDGRGRRAAHHRQHRAGHRARRRGSTSSSVSIAAPWARTCRGTAWA